MGVAGDSKAPTVVIETVLVVRPIKVIGVLFGVIAVLLLALSIAATAWLHADGAREGLWERCTYNQTVPDWVDCGKALPRGWVTICQSLCLVSLIICIIAIVLASVGLRTANFQAKYKLYWAGLVCFFIAALIEIISLVIFPIKFLDEIDNREQAHWSVKSCMSDEDILLSNISVMSYQDMRFAFGWAYIVGWVGAVAEFVAGLLLLLDRGAEEIIYREKVVQEETKNGIEVGGNKEGAVANTSV